MSQKRCFCFTCMKPVNLNGMVCEDCFSSNWQCLDEDDKDTLRAWINGSEECTVDVGMVESGSHQWMKPQDVKSYCDELRKRIAELETMEDNHLATLHVVNSDNDLLNKRVVELEAKLSALKAAQQWHDASVPQEEGEYEIIQDLVGGRKRRFAWFSEGMWHGEYGIVPCVTHCRPVIPMPEDEQ